MSKDIIIQEGGVGRQLSVDKLKTALVGGGTCLWVPEDAVALGKKTITEDGTYKAADDDLYGYSQVTVRGIGKTTGKVNADNLPSNPGNNEYVTDTDGNGDITFTLLPSSIQIEVSPDKLDYIDGEMIDTTGLVVKAYTQDGALWTDATHPDGVIPISELFLPEPAADIDKAKHGQEYAEYANTGTVQIKTVGSILAAIDYAVTLFRAKVNDGGVLNYIKNAVARYDGVNPGIVRVSVNSGYNSQYQGWSPFDVCVLTGVEAGDAVQLGSARSSSVRVSTYANGGGGRLNFTDYRVQTGTSMDIIVGQSPESTSWGIFVSTIDALTFDGQTIPVQWVRPGDGKTLETKFNIEVTII